MKHLLSLLLLLCTFVTYSQGNAHIYIKDAESKDPLIEVVVEVKGTLISAVSDTAGLVTLNQVPSGEQVLRFIYSGYGEKEQAFAFPLQDTITVLLEESAEELEEVVITSTRSSRSISDIPTRVEFVSGEELDEKANMKPGDIRMLLSESTGIQVQQTSATTANAVIRMQGLDGRYTQILKDGFPLYAGFSGGLGLLQTPPLDLKQVEIIKGASSTLYGGGAIAGLVNLISKTPDEKRELRFLVNGTSAGGLDVNGYYGQRFKKFGLTLFAARNSNAPYDPAKIDISAIPKFERYTLNPKLFYYFNPKTKLILGLNTGWENRIGGDIHYLKGKGDSTHRYFERNNSRRVSSQLSLEHDFGRCSHFTVKNSLNSFDRKLSIPDYRFDGTQLSSYTEANYAYHGEKYEWVLGGNLWTDQFKESSLDTMGKRDYTLNTAGIFVQNTMKANSWFSLESGLRADHTFDYGWAFLPRVSSLFKINKKLTSRLGGGMGYKAPTLFTEETEFIQFRGVAPISPSNNKLELSYGANWDINYKTVVFRKISLAFNHLFFYTYVDSPLLLRQNTPRTYHLENINGYMDSKGTETNLRLGYKDFKLFLGYTYTDAREHRNGISSEKTLTPRHRINSVLIYEVEEKWKVGLEGYYFSPQKLPDGSYGKDYWLCGFMVERLWERFSVYINFENFLDARQTRFENIYTGSLSNPTFRNIYAPLEGFVVNGGLKIRL